MTNKVYKYNHYIVSNAAKHSKRRLNYISYVTKKKAVRVPLFPYHKVAKFDHIKDMDKILSMFYKYVRSLNMYIKLNKYHDKVICDSYYYYKISGVKRLTKAYFVNSKNVKTFDFRHRFINNFRDYVSYSIHSMYKNMNDYVGYGIMLGPFSAYTKALSYFLEVFSVYRGYNANRTYYAREYCPDGLYGKLFIRLYSNEYRDEHSYSLKDLNINPLAYEFLYNAANGRSRYE